MAKFAIAAGNSAARASTWGTTSPFKGTVRSPTLYVSIRSFVVSRPAFCWKGSGGVESALGVAIASAAMVVKSLVAVSGEVSIEVSVEVEVPVCVTESSLAKGVLVTSPFSVGALGWPLGFLAGEQPRARANMQTVRVIFRGFLGDMPNFTGTYQPFIITVRSNGAAPYPV